MGKYMRKSKAAAEVAVMDVSQSALGVRTRAKTLALQRLQKASAPASSSPPCTTSNSSGYLQLRSRRLLKPPIFRTSTDSFKKPKVNPTVKNPNPNCIPILISDSTAAGARIASANSNPIGKLKEDVGRGPNEGNFDRDSPINDEEINAENNEEALEASFGENVLDSEGRGRSTRESTPCSLVKNPDSLHTPSSTTRPGSLMETNQRLRSSRERHIPTSREMDEFFAGAEEEQQRQFTEKYAIYIYIQAFDGCSIHMCSMG
ncbi:hypothetical protein Ancab_014057 [Ancistrocladus abbreviatus]